YGWEPPDRASSEVQEFQKRRDFAAAEASPDAMRVLDRMCEQYEVTYLRAWLSLYSELAVLGLAISRSWADFPRYRPSRFQSGKNASKNCDRRASAPPGT